MSFKAAKLLKQKTMQSENHELNKEVITSFFNSYSIGDLNRIYYSLTKEEQDTHLSYYNKRKFEIIIRGVPPPREDTWVLLREFRKRQKDWGQDS